MVKAHNAFILFCTILLVCAFGLSAMAAEKPIYIFKSVSPNANIAPEHEESYVPVVGEDEEDIAIQQEEARIAEQKADRIAAWEEAQANRPKTLTNPNYTGQGTGWTPTPGEKVPANDECADAIVLNTFPAVVDASTVDATTSCPVSLPDRIDVWYALELPYGTNNVNIDFCGQPVELYSISATLHTDCSCDETSFIYFSGGQFYNCGDPYDVPSIDWNGIAGPTTVYYAVSGSTIDGPDEELDFHFTVSVEEVVPPDNDNCADAEAIGDVIDLAFNTSQATADGAGYTSGSPNIWYCYTATCTGEATVSLCGSGFDTKLAVYDGCDCGLTTLLASNDDFCSLQSEVTFSVVAGQSYLVEVGGYGTASGGGVLNVSCADMSTGACCDPAVGTCTDDTDEATCLAMYGGTGVWHPGVTCAEDPCFVASEGDDCTDPIKVDIPDQLPYTDLGNYTCGRGNAYPATDMCYNDYYGNGEDIVYELTVYEDTTVVVTIDPKGTTWTYCQIGLECPPVDATCITYFRNTGGGVYSSEPVFLAAGTYYMILDTWPSPDCIPDFDVTIEGAVPPVGRCCYGDPYAPDCGDMTEGDCFALGGDWDGDLNCTDNPCVPLSPGDNCDDPYLVKMPDDAVDGIYTNNNYTCGRGNNYANTCLGSYDGGEDIVYELDVEGPLCLTLELDPLGTGWTGIMIADACGDVDPCIASSTASSGAHAIEEITLETGLYYVIIDTWPSPDCIPSFDLNITICGEEIGRCCLPDLTCLDISQNECNDLGGSFDATKNCTDNPCLPLPANDNCEDVTPVTLSDGVTETFSGYNTGATNQCTLLEDNGHVWEAFTLPTSMDVTIEYCGTIPAFELVYVVLAQDCPCEAGGELLFATSTNWDICGNGNVTMFFECLDAGTYYLPVLAEHPDYPADTYYYNGDYVIDVTGEFCLPDYCSASGGCDEFIENVTVAEINNTTACDGYADFTGQIATMQYGVGYDITVTIGNAYSSDLGAVWVDWNQDLDFDDANELVVSGSGAGPYVGTITPPVEALPGITRMRVRLSYSTMPGPCGVTSYGEVEDYSINVGGEVSDLIIDPTSVDFGNVLPNATGNTAVTLTADGTAAINFSSEVQYVEKSTAVGGGPGADLAVKSNPNDGDGYVDNFDKDATAILTEDFEGGVVPPTGWTLESNNPYTWEIDNYDPYEGAYNASCYYDETYAGPQSEWLISPVLDLSAGTFALDFWFLGSYYWSVDPYDNCDLQIWVSIDGGATWPMEVWNSDNYGEFDNWAWYNAVVDLSMFEGESNVKVAFVYDGYDGAQFSIDAIQVYEFTPPLNWLSVTPATGSVPGEGSLGLTLAYDMGGLELGTYEANVVLTHTGNKGSDVIPVTITVADEEPVTFVPDPVYTLMQFAIEPLTGIAYITADDGYDPNQMNMGTMTINGLTPTAMDLTDGTMTMEFNLTDFITGYGILWDTTIQAYEIAGEMNDTSPMSIIRDVMFVGHVSGDANLDGMVNVGDAVFIVSYVFKGGQAPRILETADANCNDEVNIGDVVRLVNYVFRGGAEPCHIDAQQ